MVKDLKFSIALSDPAEPLVSTKDKYIKEDLSGKNGRENNFESSVIFYTAGGGFFKNKHSTNAKRNTLNKIVNFSPKLVLSAKTIVIVLEDHNEQASKLVYDYLIGDSDKDMAEIKKRSNGGIVIFNPHDNSNSRFIDVTKNNLKDSIKIISNYTNGKEEFRIKVLTNIIAVKLKIAKEDLLQYLPEYGEEIKKIVNSINKSRTLKSAFDYAFSLFKRKHLLFGFVHEDGEFAESLKKSKSCVVGIKNNNYQDALKILISEEKQTNYGYKRDICAALTARIKKWYKLENS